MAYIKIDLNGILMDGHNVTFKAPCDCTAIDGLKVCYIENSELKEKIFTMKDTHGNTLTGLGNLFMEGAYVHAILDTGNMFAYLQNADTNGYVEAQFAELSSKIIYIERDFEDIAFDAGTIGTRALQFPVYLSGYASEGYECIGAFVTYISSSVDMNPCVFMSGGDVYLNIYRGTSEAIYTGKVSIRIVLMKK